MSKRTKRSRRRHSRAMTHAYTHRMPMHGYENPLGGSSAMEIGTGVAGGILVASLIMWAASKLTTPSA